jgi:hypothetical protein
MARRPGACARGGPACECEGYLVPARRAEALRLHRPRPAQSGACRSVSHFSPPHRPPPPKGPGPHQPCRPANRTAQRGSGGTAQPKTESPNGSGSRYAGCVCRAPVALSDSMRSRIVSQIFTTVSENNCRVRAGGSTGHLTATTGLRREPRAIPPPRMRGPQGSNPGGHRAGCGPARAAPGAAAAEAATTKGGPGRPGPGRLRVRAAAAEAATTKDGPGGPGPGRRAAAAAGAAAQSSGGGGSLVEAAAMPSCRVVVPVEGFVAEFMQNKDGNQR